MSGNLNAWHWYSVQAVRWDVSRGIVVDLYNPWGLNETVTWADFTASMSIVSVQ